MTLPTPFAVAITKHLNDQPYRDEELAPEMLIDIDVYWDDGDRYNPTYGDSQVPPSLTISATFRSPLGHKVTHEVGPSWALTALMKLALGLYV